jgi:hypothetical protein
MTLPEGKIYHHKILAGAQNLSQMVVYVATYPLGGKLFTDQAAQSLHDLLLPLQHVAGHGLRIGRQRFHPPTQLLKGLKGQLP